MTWKRVRGTKTMPPRWESLDGRWRIYQARGEYSLFAHNGSDWYVDSFRSLFQAKLVAQSKDHRA